MLIFGASAGDWKEKARYAEDKADNDFAKIREIRCEGIDDVQTALAAMAAFASDGNCKQFIYHATINLCRGERLTTKQWFHAIDRLESELGLTGHHRVAFEHIKRDRQHYHIYWNRVPPQGGATVNMGNDYYACEKMAIELEKEFGLKTAPRRSKDNPSQDKQQINDKNSRLRIQPEIVTAEVTAIYKNSKTSDEFIKTLAQNGYTLCKGKKNSLVLVDRQGGYHGLLRRLDGVTKSDLGRKFPDIRKMQFPTLNVVLGQKRPKSPKKSFKAACQIVRPARFVKTPIRTRFSPSIMPTIYRGKSLQTLIAEINRKSKSEQKRKHYPAPFIRRRKRKLIENEPARPNFNLVEIQNAELLAWAWENKRFDVLASFGIMLPLDFFEP